MSEQREILDVVETMQQQNNMWKGKTVHLR